MYNLINILGDVQIKKSHIKKVIGLRTALIYILMPMKGTRVDTANEKIFGFFFFLKQRKDIWIEMREMKIRLKLKSFSLYHFSSQLKLHFMLD